MKHGILNKQRMSKIIMEETSFIQYSAAVTQEMTRKGTSKVLDDFCENR